MGPCYYRDLSSCGQQGLLSSCSAQAAHCGGFSWCRHTGSAVVPGLSSSVAWGLFLDQGASPCPLHWQAGSLHTATREALTQVFTRASSCVNLQVSSHPMLHPKSHCWSSGVASLHYVTIMEDVVSPNHFILTGHLCVCVCVCDWHKTV